MNYVDEIAYYLERVLTWTSSSGFEVILYAFVTLYQGCGGLLSSCGLFPGYKMGMILSAFCKSESYYEN